MGLLSRLFDPEGSSGRLRAQTENRLQSAAQAVTDPSGDSVPALLRKNQSLILEINSSAGELPPIGVVLAHSLVDYPIRTTAIAAVVAMAAAFMIQPPAAKSARSRSGSRRGAVRHLDADAA